MSAKIEDVVKRLRDRAEARRRSGKLLQIDDRMFDLIADEIEAAHKREREATCKESLQVGNAAKMREALENIKECYENDYLSLDRDPGDVLGNAALLAENALSATLRNCDKIHDVHKMSIAESPLDMSLVVAPREELLRFIYWLFADAKGGEK